MFKTHLRLTQSLSISSLFPYLAERILEVKSPIERERDGKKEFFCFILLRYYESSSSASRKRCDHGNSLIWQCNNYFKFGIYSVTEFIHLNLYTAIYVRYRKRNKISLSFENSPEILAPARNFQLNRSR